MDTIPRSVRTKISKVRRDIEEMESVHGYEIDLRRLVEKHDLSLTDIHVLEGNYLCSLESVLNYICDKRSLYHDHVLCRPSFRSSYLS